MSYDSRQLIQTIQDCDLRSLSPKALAALMGILSRDLCLEHHTKATAKVCRVAEEHYEGASTLGGKMQWLEALYRMTGVFAPLAFADSYLEDECDERFDDLLAQHGPNSDTPLCGSALYEPLLCYRLHRNLVCPAPYDPQLRTRFLKQCQQWVIELTGNEPQMWYSQPLTERLQRLWMLHATGYKALLHLDPDHFAPARWQDVETCFYRCRQQLRRMEQPDVETLTAYYWTLCAFYPDADGTHPDAYEEFFELFDRTLSTLQLGTDAWWQLMEIEVHHRKDTTKEYHRYSLPDLSLLNKNSMHDFRMAFYRWTFMESDFCDIQTERDMKGYATECAEQLMPYLNRILKHQIDFGPDTEVAYLLTLQLALTLAEKDDQKERVESCIIDHLPQLPASRYKTHLETHLYISGHDALLAEALDAASQWAPDTLTDEDTYILRYLQEEQDFITSQTSAQAS